jgi:hypothetical protein
MHLPAVSVAPPLTMHSAHMPHSSPSPRPPATPVRHSLRPVHCHRDCWQPERQRHKLWRLLGRHLECFRRWPRSPPACHTELRPRHPPPPAARTRRPAVARLPGHIPPGRVQQEYEHADDRARISCGFGFEAPAGCCLLKSQQLTIECHMHLQSIAHKPQQCNSTIAAGSPLGPPAL